MLRFQNGDQKTHLASRKKSRDKNLKNHFPEGVFNKIWFKVAEHEYINIFEIRYEKKNILFKHGAQNKVCDIAK